MKKRLSEIEEEMSSPDFWNDQKKAQSLSTERNRIEGELNTFSTIEQKLEDVEVLLEMAEEENEESLLDEVEETLNKLQKTLDSLEVKLSSLESLIRTTP